MVYWKISVAWRSYVHLHSLDGSLRAVAAIIGVVVDVCWHAAHSTAAAT